MIYQPTESQIQTQLMQWLRYNGYFCLRLNSGFARTTSATGKMGMIKLAPAGTPDLLCIKNGQAYFIEVKRSVKHKPTPLQYAKMEELRSFGAKCIIACSIEDLEREL